jgi:hypothetical protein
MTNTQALLERARQRCEPQTWYELAKRTGIAETTISRCMRRGGTLDNEGAFRLAEFLGIQHDESVALIETDRAKTPDKKTFWERYLPRLLPATIAALAVAGGLQRAPIATTSERSIHYANRRRLSAAARLGRARGLNWRRFTAA